jgi:hypothetical protein
MAVSSDTVHTEKIPGIFCWSFSIGEAAKAKENRDRATEIWCFWLRRVCGRTKNMVSSRRDMLPRTWCFPCDADLNRDERI